MGKQGVEPTDLSNDTVEAIWQGTADRLALAKRDAKEVRQRGESISAHSIMLSAYISILGGEPLRKLDKTWLLLCALWHAMCLYGQSEKLNHNQLDVLVQFFLGLKKKTGNLFPPIKLEKLAWVAVHKAKYYPTSKPHQVALAWMSLAEVQCLKGEKICLDTVYTALRLAPDISYEVERLQGLRQLIRLYRKAAEIRLFMASFRSEDLVYQEHNFHATECLKSALRLAEGEANSPDQVKKIRSLMRKHNLTT